MAMTWGVVVMVVVSFLHVIPPKVVDSAALPNCSLPAIYAFGDSLTDVGNSIAAYPDQFQHAELEPYGVQFPMHAADRYSDGKLLVDFFEFAFRGRPNYASLRSISGDFAFGTNFAASGATARNSTGWLPYNGFNVPFSLNVQLEWLQRYKTRLMYYYFPSTTVKQDLPTYESLNASLYMVYAGYQDYFYDLFDKKTTARESLDTVTDVVAAITTHLEGLVAFEAKMIIVVNLPPLGCMPALLTLYPGTTDQYNQYGCLTEFNKITSKHNQLLGEEVISLRAKYPTVTFYYGDLHGVYTDVLKDPAAYNVTETLKAACGYGGNYNYNTDVTCGYTGVVDGTFVNLTSIDYTVAANYLSFDGIHLSNTMNLAVSNDFFNAKHITPEGGFNCAADFSRFLGRT